ncbi:hypothetical protein CONPUDRAFT_161474 [Coniophora puteana RWD-64-598 SS2]|uniref:Golgi apparatus membrane protein TVP38 n=1 Tax=Coniophora puteana (strain RWD-64-598) TaxID=741705 RepID=A0A5M3N5Y8_CONPW|nr:uncharacterized protein CONPUDRAFT_161474 [Coniophora puteana RWD-64-598 SS2]EIW86840.1 hypothetical protein CONPUDRAFT_161474 [Coniophora puteana RWD-64-598 SS2]
MDSIQAPQPLYLSTGDYGHAPANSFTSGDTYAMLSTADHEDDALSLSERHTPESRNIEPSRTPSPTPSETQELNEPFGGVNWKRFKHPGKREWIEIVVFIISIALSVLMIVYNGPILEALLPAALWVKDATAGWLIPIGIMILQSFPPLFGQEIIHTLCGFTYGAWVGFGIVAAGTIIGESLITVKYLCKSYGEKIQKKSITIAAFCNVVQQGGFKIILLTRFSVIPPHLSTAVFAFCRVSYFQFLLAAVLAMPKQFSGVYLGYAMLETAEHKDSAKTDSIITYVSLAVTIIVTIPTMRYLSKAVGAEKEKVVYARRKERQAIALPKDYSSEYYSGSRESMERILPPNANASHIV